ncbi:uncharacterized protein EKO05_0001137 [Ascochyta rabiei]|uniref:uncharacterized protein n=1 Tax=Didymella rabiei TaxID=5454 RepID=UPI00220055DE|nr:uncharacterized protein EKO05_0001137 [Ascochyta rabiei]UPX10479.1 hypothetical protein EKO05_0001137 [Ascochyta rabiei]
MRRGSGNPNQYRLSYQKENTRLLDTVCQRTACSFAQALRFKHQSHVAKTAYRRWNRNPRPLLPGIDRNHSPKFKHNHKRPRASVACETCRVKRTKCTAERPTCARCKSRGVECQYAVDSDDENRRKSLKKRFEWADRERNQLRDLFNILTTRTESEADEIYRRLRSSGDPIRVLHFVKQAYLLLPNPGPVSQLSAHPQVERLDAEAYRLSPWKLRARPWTAVADDGLVSALISAFFAWDGYYFLPFVDQKCFIRDMRTGDIKRAKFCSPFLVNAICTIQVSPFLINTLSEESGLADDPLVNAGIC